MTTLLNASTSNGLIVTSDTSGNLDIQSNGVSKLKVTSAGVTTVDTFPAFSAYQSPAQTIPANTWTKINFQIEEFDTNSNFASSRFTPTIAGYYQINSGIQVASTATPMALILYKNGTQFKSLFDISTNIAGGSGSSLIYMNGSTDYLEVYAYIVTGQALTGAGQLAVYFSGVMVRSA